GKNSWYFKDRLSGSIALAYNYNVPMIVDDKLKQIYGIEHCIVYKNSLEEVIEKVVNLAENEYANMVLGFTDKKKKIVGENHLVLKKIIFGKYNIQ
ncbi:MAG: hypothetical protein QW303_04920, partial [Nitrososphaerota archaeon]